MDEYGLRMTRSPRSGRLRSEKVFHSTSQRSLPSRGLRISVIETNKLKLS